VYREGESFGELALLYNAPRQASIKAAEDSVLWSLDRNTFNNIVKEAAMLLIYKAKRERDMKNFLSQWIYLRKWSSLR
jgi:CRP-like cAMP-binding protein